MPNTYYFVARPETIASIIYTGKMPDVLPDYITERHIKLYVSYQEALENNSAIIQRQAYLIAMEIPESASAISLIHEVDLSWLSKIYVSSLAGEKAINNLCRAWCKSNQHQNEDNRCCLPIEIKDEWFDSQAVSTAVTFSLSEQPAFFGVPSSSSMTIKTPCYIKDGDVLQSKMHVLVNTVNCVGAMGKGIALAFKTKYPEMFEDYKKRCEQRKVKLGEPYLYKMNGAQWILNFPTKYHWCNDSQLEWIEDGLKYLVKQVAGWGIKSMAFPPLGCGNGNLKWSDVYPVMRKHLDKLPIPIEIHSPWVEPKRIMQTTSVRKRELNTAISANDNSNNANSNVSMSMNKK